MQKIILKLHFTLILLFAIIPLSLQADINIPENPNLRNASNYIADPENLVPAESKEEANSILATLRKETTVEAAVVVVNSIGDLTAPEYCEKVFTSWGLGKKDRDNGVLLLIDTGGRQAFIMTGYGAEGALPDITCSRIINTYVVPAMKEGNVGKAVVDAVSSIAGILSNPDLAEELRSEEADNRSGMPLFEPGEKEALLQTIQWLATIVFLLTLIFFIYDCVSGRKKSVYGRAMNWRNHLYVYWIASALSLGMGLPLALLALFFYRSARNKKIKCPTCGTKMNKLDEVSDNAFLSPSQDLEERLNTVDYDVWECPQCHTIERLPFNQNQSTYSRCPKCNTVAMKLVSDRILRQPTARHQGQGIKTYKCMFCGHEEQRPYTISNEGLRNAAVAAGVIGAMGSGRGGGFGGGSFGGGFGGGSTGGGGGGGHW